MAQINWDNSAPYYRLVSCQSNNITFSEVIAVPPGATQGAIYFTSRDTSSIILTNLTIGLH